MVLHCIEYSILVLLFSLSGGKNKLFQARVVVKNAEWWLVLTTPDQCGHAEPCSGFALGICASILHTNLGSWLITITNIIIVDPLYENNTLEIQTHL